MPGRILRYCMTSRTNFGPLVALGGDVPAFSSVRPDLYAYKSPPRSAEIDRFVFAMETRLLLYSLLKRGVHQP